MKNANIEKIVLTKNVDISQISNVRPRHHKWWKGEQTEMMIHRWFLEYYLAFYIT